MPVPSPNLWIETLPTPKLIIGPHLAPRADLLLHLGEAWYPPAPAVRAELLGLGPAISRYPDSQSLELRQQLATYLGHGLGMEQIMTGNGSDALIDQLVSAYAGPDRAVVAPAPTFFVYGLSAIQRRAPLRTTGRRNQAEGFALDVETLLAEAAAHPGIIFLANPNNPTGDLIPSEIIAQIAENTRALVVVDECYQEFSEATCLSLIAKFPNLVILRSLSKSFALAGLRIGYAIAHPQVIETLAKIDQTFSVNFAAQRCAVAALGALDYYRPLFARTISLREQWCAALGSLGLRIFPSRANILLADYSAVGSGNLAVALRAQGIHVADFHERPGLRQCVRITVDDEPALTRLVPALRSALGQIQIG